MPKHTLLGATAALLFALSASAAHAQDAGMAEPDMTEQEMSDAVMDAAEDTMEAAEDTMEAAEAFEEERLGDDTINAPDTTLEPVMQDKTMMEGAPMTDTATMTDTAQMAPAPGTSVTVACPEGTTSQPEGTCMVTGNWNGE